jgi:hypothetical protein
MPLHLTRAYLVVGLIGMPLDDESGPWMDALMGFVQVDNTGQPEAFPTELTPPVADDQWQELRERMDKLLRIR